MGSIKGLKLFTLWDLLRADKSGLEFQGTENRMRQRMFYPLVYFRRLCLIWLDGLKAISEVQHRIETQFEGYTFLSGVMSLPFVN